MRQSPSPRALVGVTAACLAIALSGCAYGSEQTAGTAKPSAAGNATTGSTPSDSATPAVQPGPHLPGYSVGTFPPVPMFTLPNLAMLDTSLAGFSIEVDKAIGDFPGLTVTPARCDASGKVQAGPGALQLYGDGSGNYTGPDGSVQNYGDGSGSFTLNGMKVTVYGDGSGNYAKGSVSINSYGDGSGNYKDGTISLNLYGDGSGNYSNGTMTINNYGDGSGNYTEGSTRINNYGDGSGNYTDGTVTINNYGDGTGNYSDGSTRLTFGEGAAQKMQPIAKVPALGKFPKMGTIKPITSCGTVITLRDDVLFDFDKSDLRPSSKAVLTSLAKAFAQLKVSNAQIGGHTDSIGTDDYNLGLSSRRAASVVSELKGLGVTGGLQAQGFGESRPVAPNTVNGKDNPAGRQLNRRVEIFIPAGGAAS